MEWIVIFFIIWIVSKIFGAAKKQVPPSNQKTPPNKGPYSQPPYKQQPDKWTYYTEVKPEDKPQTGGSLPTPGESFELLEELGRLFNPQASAPQPDASGSPNRKVTRIESKTLNIYDENAKVVEAESTVDIKAIDEKAQHLVQIMNKRRINQNAIRIRNKIKDKPTIKDAFILSEIIGRSKIYE